MFVSTLFDSCVVFVKLCYAKKKKKRVLPFVSQTMLVDFIFPLSFALSSSHRPDISLILKLNHIDSAQQRTKNLRPQTVFLWGLRCELCDVGWWICLGLRTMGGAVVDGGCWVIQCLPLWVWILFLNYFYLGLLRYDIG